MKKTPFKIFVFDNGFIMIGQEMNREQNRKNGYILLNYCFNIRRFHNGKGLGSLANSFTSDDATLDFVGCTEHLLSKFNYSIDLNFEFNVDYWLPKN